MKNQNEKIICAFFQEKNEITSKRFIEDQKFARKRTHDEKINLLLVLFSKIFCLSREKEQKLGQILGKAKDVPGVKSARRKNSIQIMPNYKYSNFSTMNFSILA